MTNSLAVSVNRTDLHSLEVPDTFETAATFTVGIDNRGEASHVHLHLDDRLSSVARIQATNHYVDAGETRNVTVEVLDPEAWPAEPYRGRLKVVTGHGQRTRYVEIVLEQSVEETPVSIDPDLSKPRSRPAEPRTPALRAVPVAVLGAVALILAVGTLFASDGIDFLLGSFAVLAGAGCAIAAYYLLS